MTSSILMDEKGNVVKPNSPAKAIILFVVILLLLIGFGIMGEMDEDEQPAKKIKKDKHKKANTRKRK